VDRQVGIELQLVARAFYRRDPPSHDHQGAHHTKVGGCVYLRGLAPVSCGFSERRLTLLAASRHRREAAAQGKQLRVSERAWAAAPGAAGA